MLSPRINLSRSLIASKGEGDRPFLTAENAEPLARAFSAKILEKKKPSAPDEIVRELRFRCEGLSRPIPILPVSLGNCPGSRLEIRSRIFLIGFTWRERDAMGAFL